MGVCKTDGRCVLILLGGKKKNLQLRNRSSRYTMIAQVLEQVLSSDRKTRHLVLSWQDIKVLVLLWSSLMLSLVKHVSVSCVKPVLQLLTKRS